MFVGQQYLLLPQVNDTPLHVDPEGGLIGFSCLTHVVGPPLVKSTNSMYPSSQVLQLVDEPLSHSLQFATLHPLLPDLTQVPFWRVYPQSQPVTLNLLLQAASHLVLAGQVVRLYAVGALQVFLYITGPVAQFPSFLVQLVEVQPIPLLGM